MGTQAVLKKAVLIGNLIGSFHWFEAMTKTTLWNRLAFQVNGFHNIFSPLLRRTTPRIWSPRSTASEQKFKFQSVNRIILNRGDIMWCCFRVKRFLEKLPSENSISKRKPMQERIFKRDSTKTTTKDTRLVSLVKRTTNFKMREAIGIHIGQAGVQIGNACWEMF